MLDTNKFDLAEVFTPSDTPTLTYVGRVDLRLEAKFSSYMKMPNMVNSISGPSKSGKTVLINKSLDNETVIPVIGSGITSAENLQKRVLNWMEVSSSQTTSSTSSSTFGGSVQGGGEAGIPLVAKGKMSASGNASATASTTQSETQTADGLQKVISELANSGFVLFLDDFHYIKEELREEIGRQIKVAAEKGVKIVTASVPHRSDDVVRSNPKLRGRVAAFDLGYWSINHLSKIASKGFGALNIKMTEDLVRRLAEEAMGSPRLMQTICYCLCEVKEIFETSPTLVEHTVSDTELEEALSRTSQFTDFSKMLSSLHSGPRQRGQKRKEHKFQDGTTGDVYRAVLLAMRSKPISMSFTYDEKLNRVRQVCVSEPPVGSSINSYLEQMNTISETMQPERPVLAWDGDNLDVIDPYFAFFPEML